MTGDVAELDDCFEFINDVTPVCFEVIGDAPAVEIPEAYVENVLVSEHSDDSYNGLYVRGDDWNGYPHFVMGDKHLFYFPDPYDETGYWQLDNREQDGT